MSRSSVVVSSIVTLLAVLAIGAMAVGAVLGGPTTESPSSLVANGIESRDTVMIDAPEVMPRPTLPAYRPAPSSEGVTPPTLPATTVAPVTTTIVEPDPAPTIPAPAPAPAPPLPPSPSSWSVVRDGLTITARIEPSAPRVGDTVTVFYGVTGAGDVCCGSTLEVPADGVVAATNLPPLGTCPMDRVTSWSSAVVASRPGPITFLVHGAMFGQFCTGPPSTPVTLTLRATFEVLPAL